MSSITANTNFDQVKDDQLTKWLTIFGKDVVSTVNGNLDFLKNFKCRVVQVNFSAANVQQAITHGLGFVPIGCVQIKQSTAGHVIEGDTPWTKGVIYVKRNTVGACTLLIF